MKLVFISNYLNLHQLPLCNAFSALPDIDFTFIATQKISQERQKLGYRDIDHSYGFTVCSYDGKEEYQRALDICREADVVVIGNAPSEFFTTSLKHAKLVFRSSERPYKTMPPSYQFPIRKLIHLLKIRRHKNFYLLCSGAYTAADYAKTSSFIGKAYKWGYFPEVKKYDDIASIIKNKKTNSILWAGRLIGYKNPEYAIEVARRLKADGYDFSMNFIGTGELENSLREQISLYDLEDCVKLLGPMPTEKTREFMEQSEIFLFTSNRLEGWGAVLNEAMSGGCAVVTNNKIGSVPFLVKDQENGLIYQDGDVDALYDKVKYLLDNPDKRREMGEKAYKTLSEEWNAEVAAKRFVELVSDINSTKFDDGPCSVAEILTDND